MTDDIQLPIKEQLQNDIKDAMRAHNKELLLVLRLIHSAIRQREIDERIDLDDAQVIATLEKMLKQRRDSIEQFESAGRQELADKEKTEVEIISKYMPAALSEEEIDQFIRDAIKQTNAESIRDMGKVMGAVKSKVQGRADMGKVGAKIKALLG